jgi:translocation and assembly module TamB
MLRSLNILRRLLLIVLFALLLFGTWLINTESGLNWALQRAQPYLPGELQLVEVVGTLSGPIHIGALHYRNNGISLDAETLLINWSPTLLATGQLRFSELKAEHLAIHLPEAESQPVSARGTTHTEPPEVNLPFAISVGVLEIGNILIDKPGSEPVMIDNLNARAKMLLQRVKIEKLKFGVRGTEVHLNGEISLKHNYPHDLNFRWQMAKTPYGHAAGEGRLHGNLVKTQLTHTLDSPLKARLDVKLADLLDKLHWQGKLNVAPVALQKLSSDLPPFTIGLKTEISGDLQQQQAHGSLSSNSQVLGPLNGRFRISHAGDLIRLQELVVETSNKSRRAEAHGNWQISDGIAEVGLSWQGLSWPWQGAAEISSGKGSALLKGKPDDYLLNVAGDIETPYWSDSDLSAVGHGTLSGLEFKTARLLSINGEVNGPVTLDWSNGFSWKTSLQGKGLDPGRQWSSWPGKINFAIDSKGNTREGLSATLNVKKLDGTLRGYPVDLNGHLDWQNDTLTLNNVRFTSADSHVSADGRIGATMQLNWRLQSNELAELHPDFHGALNATGTLQGTKESPLLSLKLKGSQLAWHDQHIGSIEADGDMDLSSWQSSGLVVKAKALQLYGQSLEQADIAISPAQQQQRLELKVVHNAATLSLLGTGNLQQQAWHGSLHDISIDSADYGNWRQQQAVSVELSRDHLLLEPLCLTSDKQRLCLGLTREQQQWSLKLNGDRVSLALLAAWLPDRMTLQGDAGLSLQASYDPESKLQGHGEIVLGRGQLEYPLVEGEPESWQFREGKIDLTLDNSGLRSDASLTINDRDYFRANATLAKFDPFAFDPAKQEINAGLEVAFSDLALLQSFVFETQDVKGHLLLNADIGGTLRKPQLGGKLTLSDGALRLPRFGLDIKQVSFTMDSSDKGHLNYQLSGRSGDGRLSMTGTTELNPGNGWPTQLDIKGENVEVVNIPEARVNVSPDIKVRIKGRRIDSEGEIKVPYARLQPKDLSSANMPSDDVHIEGTEHDNLKKWKLYSNIRLILGNRVTLNGFGFEGRIDGNLLLSDKPNEPTIGVGELNVPEGRYRAYGQRLDIERGRLLFASSPINNPGLDLRAVRHVQDVTAGISVGGTLRAPKFEVFSVPAMGQTDALSYLVLGRPLDNTTGADSALVANAALALGLKGGDVLARQIGDRFNLDEMRIEASETGDQASLVMGRYLSPKLYVSYGVGLIESFNTINLRYEISRNWQLTAESGQNQGADIIYTIER